MEYTVAKDGSGDFTSLQEAIDAAAERPEAVMVRIRKGIYEERVVAHKDNLRIVGEDVMETILTGRGCAKDLHPDGTEKTTFLSATFMVTGRDVTVENLTIRNDAGDGRVVGQAVAVYAAGDRGIWRGCRFIAHQDTLYCGPLRIPDVVAEIAPRTGSAEQHPRVQDGPLTTSRQYFADCYIEGDVDFIFGNYTCWFEGCTLFMNERGGWYTAANTHQEQPYGLIFHRCRLTGSCGEGRAYLGRPWREYAGTFFLECEMEACVAPEGFTDWDETRKLQEGRCGEWATTGARADLRTRHPMEKRLTREEAAALTPDRVLRGNDAWRPAP